MSLSKFDRSVDKNFKLISDFLFLFRCWFTLLVFFLSRNCLFFIQKVLEHLNSGLSYLITTALEASIRSNKQIQRYEYNLNQRFELQKSTEILQNMALNMWKIFPLISSKKPLTQGWQFLRLYHSSRNRGIKEWQFNIPRGSRKINFIPRGPRGISRNKFTLMLIL